LERAKKDGYGEKTPLRQRGETGTPRKNENPRGKIVKKKKDMGGNYHRQKTRELRITKTQKLKNV